MHPKYACLAAETRGQIPVTVNAFGINYITHQLLIGTDVIFKLYSTITRKKAPQAEVDYRAKLRMQSEVRMVVKDLEPLILVNC